MANDHLLQRIKESVLRARYVPARTVQPAAEAENSLHQSIRQLARSRVSLALRQLRSSYGYSYEDVRGFTGLSQQLLFDVEFKERRLTLDELRILAEFYEVNVNDLIGIDIE